MEDFNNSVTEPETNSNDISSNEISNNLSGVFDDADNTNSPENTQGLVNNENNQAQNKPAYNEENHNNIDNSDTSITYYSKDELIELGKPENADNIDINKIPPEIRWAYKLFQRPYTQKSQKLSEERKAFEQEKKSFQDELEEFRKEQDRQSNMDILDTGRLSNKDENDISKISLMKVQEAFNEDFDNNNPEHIKLYKDIRNKLSTVLYNERVGESINNRLVQKYGQDFVIVERAAQQEFRKMPHDDSMAILKARQTGRYDIIEKFYDSVFNKLLDEHKKIQEMQSNNNFKPDNQPQQHKMPPATISTSSGQIKTGDSSMYNLDGVF